MKASLFGGRREVNISEFNGIVKNRESVWNLVTDILKKEEYLVSLKSEENRLNNLYLSLLPWKELDVPLDFAGTQKTVFQYGTIPSIVDWNSVVAELTEKIPNSYVERINSDKDQHYVFFIVHRENEEECLSYLQSKGYSRATFSGLTGTVAENIERINGRISEIMSEREKTIEKIKNMAGHRSEMEVLYDWLLMEKSRLEATEKFIKTKKVFMIKGWVPERNAPDVKKLLESKFVVYVEIEEPGKNEEFPVLLENRGIAETGEPVMKMYSLPSSREIDPTLLWPRFS
ncbi:hypothetical protein [Thermoclostridium stercorarium]|uniref:hypothetical protein n=1 Tax=Thermoclostridium stercorarium TaxID=1510 RepID=UPI000B2A99B4|nr:hypothetical protein [Thermoclostridium stercorarium]